jgi:hypothetical protein
MSAMGRVGIEPTTLGLKGVSLISADLGLACKSTILFKIGVATISAGLGPSSCHFVATLGVAGGCNSGSRAKRNDTIR